LIEIRNLFAFKRRETENKRRRKKKKEEKQVCFKNRNMGLAHYSNIKAKGTGQGTRRDGQTPQGAAYRNSLSYHATRTISS
jgi:hypothetical protein